MAVIMEKRLPLTFNPEINIREITQKGRYYENGEWVETEPFEICKSLTYPGNWCSKFICALSRGVRILG